MVQSRACCDLLKRPLGHMGRFSWSDAPRTSRRTCSCLSASFDLRKRRARIAPAVRQLRWLPCLLCCARGERGEGALCSAVALGRPRLPGNVFDGHSLSMRLVVQSHLQEGAALLFRAAECAHAGEARRCCWRCGRPRRAGAVGHALFPVLPTNAAFCLSAGLCEAIHG